jgi:hypothetical protein
MILIQRGDNLCSLLANLTKIHGKQEISEALFFHTIPCIRRESNNGQWIITKVSGEMYWRIGISCYNIQPPTIISELLKPETKIKVCPDAVSDAIQSLSDLITIDYAYGKRDIIIRPKNPSRSLSLQKAFSPLETNFLNNLLEVIGSIGENKIETKTELFIDHEDLVLSKTPCISIPNKKNPLNKPNLSKQFEQWFTAASALRNKEKMYNHLQFDCGNKLLDLIERFQLTYNIPQMWEIIFDMKDFLNTIILELADNITKKLPNKDYLDCEQIIPLWYIQLEDSIQVFNYSLDKRLAGVELGIGNKVVSSISGLGNFRTLLAAKAVSFALFKASGDNWNGFTIFSYKPNTSCLANGIINMPGYSIDDLQSWIQLGHETGHAYVDQHHLMNESFLTKSLENSLKSTTFPEFNSIEDCEGFIDELFADVFEYLICFGGNFELYRNTTWHNLDQDLFTNDESDSVFLHILRTISIFFIHLENIGLLAFREPLVDKINVKNGLSNVYEEKDGIRNYVLGKIGSIQELISNNIIGPLLDDDRLNHIKHEIKEINLGNLCQFSICIDQYRSIILSLFLDPIKKKNKLIVKNNYEKGNWERIITNFTKTLSKEKIVNINKDNPIEVSCLLLAIQNLKENQEINSNINLAAILSLWHYYRMEFVSSVNDELLSE